jgi:hypothetical protein
VRGEDFRGKRGGAGEVLGEFGDGGSEAVGYEGSMESVRCSGVADAVYEDGVAVF